MHYDVEVGLWNLTNSCYYYGMKLYGGSGSGSYDFNNLPGGTHRICVYNRGSDALTSGNIKSHI